LYDQDKYTAEFSKIFREHFQVDFIFRDQLKRYETILRQLGHAFKKLVYELQGRHKCICLIQDCDYLAERVIFAEACKDENIPTAALDHSVNLTAHLFTGCRSQYAIVWGRYQYDRIKNFSSNQPRKIFITGKPGCTPAVKSTINKSRRSWVYLLPAFQEPHLQSFCRSMEDSLKRIKELQILASQYGNYLYVKPHPSDEIRIFPEEIKLTNKSLDKLSAHCCLFIVEDSTTAIEVIKYDVPVIYLADRLNHDPLNIKNYSNVYNYCFHEQSISEIIQRLNTHDQVKRKNFYNYFISDQNEKVNLNNITDPQDENILQKE
jgi:hypothetical protein